MTRLSDFDQIEFERLRRMKECFDATQPDQSELVRAVQRWHRAKAERVSGGRLRLAWVAACAMMLSGAAMAASNWRALPNFMSHTVVFRAKPATVPAQGSAPAPPVASAVQDLALSRRPQSAFERNTPARMPAPSDRDLNLPVANANLDFDSPELKGAWERAAGAMRQGDERAAISALTEISQSADPANRDAALLARAQLDMAAGRRELALAALRNLASTASTAFIRQRASEILSSGR